MTKNPVTACRIVLRMAQNYAADNLQTLTQQECESLELVARSIMRLERLLKKGK